MSKDNSNKESWSQWFRSFIGTNDNTKENPFGNIKLYDEPNMDDIESVIDENWDSIHKDTQNRIKEYKYNDGDFKNYDYSDADLIALRAARNEKSGYNYYQSVNPDNNSAEISGILMKGNQPLKTSNQEILIEMPPVSSSNDVFEISLDAQLSHIERFNKDHNVDASFKISFPCSNDGHWTHREITVFRDNQGNLVVSAISHDPARQGVVDKDMKNSIRKVFETRYGSQNLKFNLDLKSFAPQFQKEGVSCGVYVAEAEFSLKKAARNKETLLDIWNIQDSQGNLKGEKSLRLDHYDLVKSIYEKSSNGGNIDKSVEGNLLPQSQIKAIRYANKTSAKKYSVNSLISRRGLTLLSVALASTYVRGVDAGPNRTGNPTLSPTPAPSRIPTLAPTPAPSRTPTSSHPTGVPTTSNPSGYPTGNPTEYFSESPSGEPTTQPSDQPSQQPSRKPVGNPSGEPTVSPTIDALDLATPTGQPTRQPSRSGDAPSSQPTYKPSINPTADGPDTGTPTGQPTRQPSGSSDNSNYPSGMPTGKPSMAGDLISPDPTATPTFNPTFAPTLTESPTITPPTFTASSFDFTNSNFTSAAAEVGANMMVPAGEALAVNTVSAATKVFTGAYLSSTVITSVLGFPAVKWTFENVRERMNPVAVETFSRRLAIAEVNEGNEFVEGYKQVCQAIADHDVADDLSNLDNLFIDGKINLRERKAIKSIYAEGQNSLTRGLNIVNKTCVSSLEPVPQANKDYFLDDQKTGVEALEELGQGHHILGTEEIIKFFGEREGNIDDLDINDPDLDPKIRKALIVFSEIGEKLGRKNFNDQIFAGMEDVFSAIEEVQITEAQEEGRKLSDIEESEKKDEIISRQLKSREEKKERSKRDENIGWAIAAAVSMATFINAVSSYPSRKRTARTAKNNTDILEAYMAERLPEINKYYEIANDIVIADAIYGILAAKKLQGANFNGGQGDNIFSQSTDTQGIEVSLTELRTYISQNYPKHSLVNILNSYSNKIAETQAIEKTKMFGTAWFREDKSSKNYAFLLEEIEELEYNINLVATTVHQNYQLRENDETIDKEIIVRESIDKLHETTDASKIDKIWKIMETELDPNQNIHTRLFSDELMAPLEKDATPKDVAYHAVKTYIPFLVEGVVNIGRRIYHPEDELSSIVEDFREVADQETSIREFFRKSVTGYNPDEIIYDFRSSTGQRNTLLLGAFLEEASKNYKAKKGDHSFAASNRVGIVTDDSDLGDNTDNFTTSTEYTGRSSYSSSPQRVGIISNDTVSPDGIELMDIESGNGHDESTTDTQVTDPEFVPLPQRRQLQSYLLVNRDVVSWRENVNQEAAATKIQALGRGYIARKDITEVNKENEDSVYPSQLDILENSKVSREVEINDFPVKLFDSITKKEKDDILSSAVKLLRSFPSININDFREKFDDSFVDESVFTSEDKKVYSQQIKSLMPDSLSKEQKEELANSVSQQHSVVFDYLLQQVISRVDNISEERVDNISEERDDISDYGIEMTEMRKNNVSKDENTLNSLGNKETYMESEHSLEGQSSEKAELVSNEVVENPDSNDSDISLVSDSDDERSRSSSRHTGENSSVPQEEEKIDELVSLPIDNSRDQIDSDNLFRSIENDGSEKLSQSSSSEGSNRSTQEKVVIDEVEYIPTPKKETLSIDTDAEDFIDSPELKEMEINDQETEELEPQYNNLGSLVSEEKLEVSDSISEKKESAAVKIQSVVRGNNSRQIVSEIKRLKEDSCRRSPSNDSVVSSSQIDSDDDFFIVDNEYSIICDISIDSSPSPSPDPDTNNLVKLNGQDINKGTSKGE